MHVISSGMAAERLRVSADADASCFVLFPKEGTDAIEQITL